MTEAEFIKLLKAESKAAWRINKSNTQAGNEPMASFYEGYGAAIDWILEKRVKPRRKRKP